MTTISRFRPHSPLRLALALGGATAACALAGQASACSGAGVVTRIEGDPAKVSIRHADGGQVARPRVLEVVCAGDVVRTTGGARITLSLDGRGTVQVSGSYSVAARGGAPSLAGNAYRAVNDQVMPDMKRLPWDVRLKGADDPLGFALASLAQGSQRIPAGRQALMVRVLGGSGPYSATLSGPGAAASATSPTGEIRFAAANLAPGAYSVTVKDASGEAVTGQFTAVAQGQPTPDLYREITDPEVRAAATAASLARGAPSTRALEAEQMLDRAPSNGLDRDRVYDLIESYGE